MVKAVLTQSDFKSHYRKGGSFVELEKRLEISLINQSNRKSFDYFWSKSLLHSHLKSDSDIILGSNPSFKKNWLHKVGLLRRPEFIPVPSTFFKNSFLWPTNFEDLETLWLQQTLVQLLKLSKTYVWYFDFNPNTDNQFWAFAEGLPYLQKKPINNLDFYKSSRICTYQIKAELESLFIIKHLINNHSLLNSKFRPFIVLNNPPIYIYTMDLIREIQVLTQSLGLGLLLIINPNVPNLFTTDLLIRSDYKLKTDSVKIFKTRLDYYLEDYA